MTASLIIGLTLICVVTIGVIVLRHTRLQLQQQDTLIQELKNDMVALLKCERGMGERLRQHQQSLAQMLERQDKLEISDGSATGYRQAMTLLQKGVSEDELIDACELSRGELALLARMKSLSTPVNGRHSL